MAEAIQISGQRSLAKTIKRKIQDTILATPFVSDVFRYHWKFLSRIGACRGVYSSYREAKRVYATFKHVGCNDRLFYGPRIAGEPILLWSRATQYWSGSPLCLNEGTQILNPDGNAGLNTSRIIDRSFISLRGIVGSSGATTLGQVREQKGVLVNK
jgi:hypothetical protein